MGYLINISEDSKHALGFKIVDKAKQLTTISLTGKQAYNVNHLTEVNYKHVLNEHNKIRYSSDLPEGYKSKESENETKLKNSNNEITNPEGNNEITNPEGNNEITNPEGNNEITNPEGNNEITNPEGNNENEVKFAKVDLTGLTKKQVKELLKDFDKTEADIETLDDKKFLDITDRVNLEELIENENYFTKEEIEEVLKGN